MSAAKVSADLSAEALCLLEQHVRRFFSSALHAARDATWEEVERLGLGEMLCEDLVAMEQRTLRTEATRLGLLGIVVNVRGRPTGMNG
jgi:hypothetical protein